MAKWIAEALAEGTVTTRESANLRPGENTAAVGFRLQPGDSQQLRRGRGYAVLADTRSTGSSQLPLAVEHISFENASFLLQVFGDDVEMVDETAFVLRLRFYLPDISEAAERVFFVAEKPVKSSLVHRGNQFFLGTNAINLRFDAPAAGQTWPTVDEMGMPALDGDPNQPLATSPMPFLNYPVGADQTEETSASDYINGWSSLTGDLNGAFNTGRTTNWLLERLYYDWADLTWDQQDRIKNLVRVVDSNLEQQTPRQLELRSFGAFACAYWYTEYDSERGLESSPGVVNYLVTSAPSSLYWWYQFEDDGTIYEVSLPLTEGQQSRVAVQYGLRTATRKNGAADYARVYRANCGEVTGFKVIWDQHGLASVSSDASSPGLQRAREYRDQKSALVGGLISEVEWERTPASTFLSEADDFRVSGTQDPPIDFPLVSVLNRGTTKLDNYLVRPDPWVVGLLFNDALLEVDASNEQVLYYSYPGEVEYQPRGAYREILATDRPDKVLGAVHVQDSALLLTQGGVHRFNYLAYEGEIFRDRQQEIVNRRHGVVGNKAFDTVETGSGEMLAWLSPQSLVVTDGYNWRDGCLDFRLPLVLAEGVDISAAVLINDPRDYALRLYLPDGAGGTHRWDFYYHPSHLRYADDGERAGSFRLFGPTPLPFLVHDAARGLKDGEDRIWLLAERDEDVVELVLEGEGWHAGASTLVLRTLMGSSPPVGINIRALGLSYTNAASESLAILGSWVGHNTGRTAPMARTWELASAHNSNHFVKRTFTGMRGDEGVLGLQIAAASGDWAIGPLWLDADLGQSADG